MDKQKRLDEETLRYLKKSIDTLAKAVKVTLGPKFGPYLRRASYGFAGVVIGASLLTAGGSTSTTSSPTSGKSGAKLASSSAGLVDIGGGRKLYLQCQGTGTPTVVLVPGLVGAADWWSYVTATPTTFKPSNSAVYPEVGRFTRVCSYDRPGTARPNGTLTTSTSVPQPTTPLRDVADLHALLTAAKVPGPHVLVGWSYGGPIVRIYASTYPHDVVGLVLVDAQSEFLQTELTPAEFAVLNKVLQADDEARIVQWKDVERQNPVTTDDQLRGAPPVPAMPVVVLSGNTFDPNAFRARLPDMPANYSEVFWRAQLAAQDSLARLFPGAVHISHTNSGHNILNEQPMLVSDWIRYVVEKVRQHSTGWLPRRGAWAGPGRMPLCGHPDCGEQQVKPATTLALGSALRLPNVVRSAPRGLLPCWRCPSSAARLQGRTNP